MTDGSAELRVRPAVAADLDALCRIEARAAPTPWDRDRFAESLVEHQVLALDAGGELRGFAVFRRVMDEAELLNIAVAPEHARRGGGRTILRAVLARLAGQARCLHLEVRAGNVPAIGLYESLGCVRVGLRRGYYPAAGGREDAILMRIDLS